MFCRHIFENDAQANGPKSINQAWARRRCQLTAQSRRSARENEIGWRCYETKGIIAADDVARRKEEVPEAGKRQCKQDSQLAVKSEHLIPQRKIKENSENARARDVWRGVTCCSWKALLYRSKSPFNDCQLVLMNFPRLMCWVWMCPGWMCVVHTRSEYRAYAASHAGTVCKWSKSRCHTAAQLGSSHTHGLVNPKLQLWWQQQEQSAH